MEYQASFPEGQPVTADAYNEVLPNYRNIKVLPLRQGKHNTNTIIATTIVFLLRNPSDGDIKSIITHLINVGAITHTPVQDNVISQLLGKARYQNDNPVFTRKGNKRVLVIPDAPNKKKKAEPSPPPVFQPVTDSAKAFEYRDLEEIMTEYHNRYSVHFLISPAQWDSSTPNGNIRSGERRYTMAVLAHEFIYHYALCDYRNSEDITAYIRTMGIKTSSESVRSVLKKTYLNNGMMEFTRKGIGYSIRRKPVDHDRFEGYRRLKSQPS